MKLHPPRLTLQVFRKKLNRIAPLRSSKRVAIKEEEVVGLSTSIWTSFLYWTMQDSFTMLQADSFFVDATMSRYAHIEKPKAALI
jgi:hypothetical protein